MVAAAGLSCTSNNEDEQKLYFQLRTSKKEQIAARDACRVRELGVRSGASHLQIK